MKVEKKSLVLVAGAVLLLLVGFLVGRMSHREAENVQPTPLLVEGLIPTSNPLPTDEPTPSLVLETFQVTRVIDGDTIEIEGGERVRYIGIDTPETVDPRKPVQCFGVEAAKKNKELVEGKEIRLEKDIIDRDKYGRLLRYVWVGDLFVNLELVKQGFATSYTYPPDLRHQAEFLVAETEAREANRGLWGACPITVLPTVETQGITDGGCNIKGNINSSGEKIYHFPGCGSYTKTQIDESRGERWFCSEEEAQAAGWRKALNCP